MVRTVRKSLPQGAISSPVLYGLYTSNLNGLDKNIKSVQFADDIAIYVTGRNRRENKRKLEMSLGTVVSRIEELDLELQPRKTVVELSKTGFFDRELRINIKGTLVQDSRSVKFLGIWLDNKMNF